ncbi:hypothetical protein [Microcoleus sp.]|uniref:hypothetical protein n=1 Tax=Microcoleus sp. TaxID=44472 RepID=UPI00403E5C02
MKNKTLLLSFSFFAGGIFFWLNDSFKPQDTASAVTQLSSENSASINSPDTKHIDSNLQGQQLASINPKNKPLLISRAETLPATTSNAEPKPSQLDTAASLSPQQEIEQRRQLRLNLLQNAFTAEGPDKAWSIPTEERLKNLVSQSFSHSNLLDVQCRETLCELDVSYDNQEAMNSFFRTLPHTLGWDASGEITYLEENDGQIRIKLFLSREGRNLPEG